MNKLVTWIIGFGIFFSILFIIFRNSVEKGLDFDLSENQSKVLLDSMKIGNDNLYWFKYESYTGNTTVSFICINSRSCLCNLDNASLKGEFIYGIKEIKNDSIFIVTKYGFDSLHSNISKYHFIDIRTDKQTASRHISRPLYFRELCR